jgi:hypothetical protein
MLIQEVVPHDRLNDEHLSFLRAISVDQLQLHPPPWNDPAPLATWAPASFSCARPSPACTFHV